MAHHDSAAPTADHANRRRREKSTRELALAIDALAAERKELVEQLLARRKALEHECYIALGKALFERRRDEDAAPVYDNIAAALGSRLRKKLDELALLPEDLE